MIEAIRTNKDIIIYLGVLLLVGFVFRPLAYVVSVLMFLGFKRRDWKLLLLVGLWFILVLSDNGRGLDYTRITKPIIIALAFIFVWLDKKSFPFKSNWYKMLWPFIIIIACLWIRHPNPITSLQKTISLILLYIPVPTLVMNAYFFEG